MRRYRLYLALAVVLAGVSLLPLIGLSAEQFEWQRYADAYQYDEVVYLPLVLQTWPGQGPAAVPATLR